MVLAGRRRGVRAVPLVAAAGLPLVWSFDATDTAGNTRRCRGVVGEPAATGPNGNGTTYPSKYRNGAWYAHNQPTVFFGLVGHVPEPRDYDGNGTVDRAVYDQGAWYIQGQPTVFWGLAGDIPLPLRHAIRSRFFP